MKTNRPPLTVPVVRGRVRVQDTSGREASIIYGDTYPAHMVWCKCCPDRWHKGADGYLYWFLSIDDAQDVADLVPGGRVYSTEDRAN